MNENVIENIARNLAELRKMEGITYEELASETGTSIGYLCFLENGKRDNPSLKTLLKLANFYEVPIEFLFSDQEDEEYPYPESS